jgi:phage-related protein
MSTIATAYVQIVPSTEGFASKLESATSEGATSSGESAGSLLGSGLVSKVLKVVAAAKIGQQVVKLISSSISAGAELEQSIGGMQTLFKSASDTMLAQAKNAYKTAGMSANEYMQTATQFSASLIKSCGGDTAKAAEYADKAIVQMSDNANKMGTNIEDIQNAYRGFAKENYTMLDNLSLGYAGTKEGMESLLADAEKISGVKYDISSYSDIVDAIGVIQDSYDITGTTAKEAEGTIEGSLNSMKAAWENFIAGMSGVWEKSGESWDMAGTVDQLVQSASTLVFGNLVPAVGAFISQVPAALSAFVQSAWSALKSEIESLTGTTDFGVLLQMGVTAITNFVDGILTDLPSLIETGGELLTQLGNGIVENLPKLASSAGTLVGNLITTIGEHLPEIISTGAEVVGNLLSGIVENAPTLIPEAILSFWGSLSSALEETDWAQLGSDILDALIGGFKNIGGKLSEAFSSASKTVSSWGQDLSSQAPTLVSGFISSVVSWFSQLPSNILSAISPAVSNVTSWGASMLSAGVQAASNLMSRVVSTLTGLPGRIWSAITGAVTRVRSWGGQLASAGMSAASKLVSSVVSGVASLPSRMVSIGSQIVHGIIRGVSSAASSLVSKMKSLASDALSAAKGALGIKSPSRVFRDQVGKWIPAGIAAGIEGNSSVVDDALSDLSNPLASELNSTLSFNANAAFGSAVNTSDSMTADTIYTAVRAGMQDADIGISMDKRVLGRTLKGMGVAFT